LPVDVIGSAVFERARTHARHAVAAERLGDVSRAGRDGGGANDVGGCGAAAGQPRERNMRAHRQVDGRMFVKTTEIDWIEADRTSALHVKWRIRFANGSVI
jgi:hypothetical protein